MALFSQATEKVIGVVEWDRSLDAPLFPTPGSQAGPLDSGPQKGGMCHTGPPLAQCYGKWPSAALLPQDNHGDQGLGLSEKGPHHTVTHWA